MDTGYGEQRAVNESKAHQEITLVEVIEQAHTQAYGAGVYVREWLVAEGFDPETPIPHWNDDAQAWEV